MDEQAFIRDYNELMHCGETGARSVFMHFSQSDAAEESDPATGGGNLFEKEQDFQQEYQPVG